MTASGTGLSGRLGARPSVTAGLPKHQDELDVVFDNGIWLVRLSEKRTTVSFRLISRIRNLVPYDGGQIAKAHRPAVVPAVYLIRGRQVGYIG